MWDFIVSGRLPGTAIQITFEQWLAVMAGLLLFVLVAMTARRIFRVLRLAALSVIVALSMPADSGDMRYEG